jgi:hypothetical protein
VLGAVVEAGIAHAPRPHVKIWKPIGQAVQKRFVAVDPAVRYYSLGKSGTYLCVLHGLRPLHYVG